MGASGTPSIMTRKRTGAPRTVTLTVAVTWLTVQRVSDSLGTFRQPVVDVVADVVVHLAAWRSRALPNTPLAAKTAAGTAASRTRPPIITRCLRMTRRLS
jgi:hypothetical protein